MINETDRLFIKSTKAVNSIPQDNKLIGEVPIKEYINFDSLGWCDFLYIESQTAFETYVNLTNCTETKVHNNYIITFEDNSVDEVIKMFITRLNLIAAKQLTIVKAGEERLIFQSRTMVQLFEKPDGMIRLRWRGRLDRIPSEPKTRPERVPMNSQNIDQWSLSTNKEVIDAMNQAALTRLRARSISSSIG